MGNKCCGGGNSLKGKEDVVSPALLAIREAQRKYFNSHIESDVDDSEEDNEDSTDGLYGSMGSLDTDSVDGLLMDDSQTSTGASGNAQTPLSNGSVASGSNGVGNGSAESGTVVKESKSTVKKRRARAKLIRLSKRGNFFSILNTEDKRARAVNPVMYDYPFENVVFEGGGNKGLAYCGCVRLLEELNVWPQIKRLAGTSAGAMTAALLAVGYDSHDLEKFFSLNLNDIFLDHKFGYLSLLPNLLSSYGWNPGKKIYKWFGQKLEHKTGNPDVTFKQVHDMFDRELCIVVTNLNQMTSLYCHPKTTPEMPVRLAVRMSMSIPGMFQAVKHTVYGQTDVFVDGGVLCNYPIHCFDGWWLSTEPEDSFLEKLQPLEDIPRLLERTERFGTYNEKTLGLQLYADNEQDLLKYQLENLRHGVQLQDLPNTKLAREKIKKKKLQVKTDREHRRLVKAMNAFLRSLRKHNADKNDTIDREELEAALQDEEYFPKKRRLILFGDVGSDIILDHLDKDHNGQISYNELVKFMEETGISMQNRFLGYQRRIIKNFPTFLDTLQATLLTNVKRVYVKDTDLKRTVGINTGHVGTSDFVLEPADIEFVLERGRRSLEAFLKYYVASNNLKKKPEFRKMKDDGRKDSKASVISVASSDINANGTDSVPTPEYPETIVESSDVLPIVNDPSEEREAASPKVVNSKNSAMRTKSASSGKSVCISDKVQVLYDMDEDLFSNNFEKHVGEGEEGKEEEDSRETEEEDNDDSDGETIFLLQAKEAASGSSGRPKSLPANVTGSASHRSMVPPSSPQTGKPGKKKPEARHSSLKSPVQVDVLVHKPAADKSETPSTPLLDDTHEESFELSAVEYK
ncbi:uncharacterized protein LOC101851335 [Aplysia californica]|uniref:Uncharacterized protein LOC101851335 n=1 Tax=Aplysia californica TaxID=6500 RepID=A0ABM0JI06_APLCA|nr:uncharacterized protein LOC101851335 [Aplysia californica]XP_005094080.1 uncharacterized protein LOC101851335 [Aplysia californica]